jgi:hypothetical protein
VKSTLPPNYELLLKELRVIKNVVVENGILLKSTLKEMKIHKRTISLNVPELIVPAKSQEELQELLSREDLVCLNKFDLITILESGLARLPKLINRNYFL